MALFLALLGRVTGQVTGCIGDDGELCRSGWCGGGCGKLGRFLWIEELRDMMKSEFQDLAEQIREEIEAKMKEESRKMRDHLTGMTHQIVSNIEGSTTTLNQTMNNNINSIKAQLDHVQEAVQTANKTTTGMLEDIVSVHLDQLHTQLTQTRVDQQELKEQLQTLMDQHNMTHSSIEGAKDWMLEIRDEMFQARNGNQDLKKLIQAYVVVQNETSSAAIDETKNQLVRITNDLNSMTNDLNHIKEHYHTHSAQQNLTQTTIERSNDLLTQIRDDFTQLWSDNRDLKEMILAQETRHNSSQTAGREAIKSHKEQVQNKLASMMKLLADATQHNDTIKAIEETQGQLLGIRMELLKIQTGNQDLKDMFENQTVGQNAAIERFENQLIQFKDEFVQFQVSQRTRGDKFANITKWIDDQVSLLQDMLRLERNSTMLNFVLIGQQLIEIQNQFIGALKNQMTMNKTFIDALAKIHLIEEHLQYQIQAGEKLQLLNQTFVGKFGGIEDKVERILDEVVLAGGVCRDANRSTVQEISLIAGQLVSIQNQMALQGRQDNEFNAPMMESIEVKFTKILDQLIQIGEDLLKLNKTSGERMLFFEDQLDQMHDQLIQAITYDQELNETSHRDFLMLTKFLIEAQIDRQNISLILFEKMIGADLQLEQVQQQLTRTLNNNVNKLQYDLDLIHLSQTNLSHTLNERIVFEDGLFEFIQQELVEAKMDRRQINATSLDQLKSTQAQLALAQIERKNMSETFFETKISTDIQLNQIREQFVESGREHQKINQTYSSGIQSIRDALIQAQSERQNLSITYFEKVSSTDTQLKHIEDQMFEIKAGSQMLNQTIDSQMTLIVNQLVQVQVEKQNLNNTYFTKVLLIDEKLDRIQDQLVRATRDCQSQIQRKFDEIRNLYGNYNESLFIWRFSTENQYARVQDSLNQANVDRQSLSQTIVSQIQSLHNLTTLAKLELLNRTDDLIRSSTKATVVVNATQTVGGE